MLILIFVLLLNSIKSQTIKQLHEIIIDEELPIGTIVTLLNDKIPNLDQSLEYDLVTPLSSNLDLFSIDHHRHTLQIKKRIDFETICSKFEQDKCLISISIAVSKSDTISVYILPIIIKNIDDNPLKFSLNQTKIEIIENENDWSNKIYYLPHAIDDDGDRIQYKLFFQNWTTVNHLFDFDDKQLLLKPLKKFDREQEPFYLLRLIAYNEQNKDVSIDIFIIIKDINDNPPVCQYNRTIFHINDINSIKSFSFNVTDIDEGDNSKLEYELINSITGFTIDRLTGQIRFDFKKWIREKQSILYVNVTDFGKPYRLSTTCEIEFLFTYLYDINLNIFNHNTEINNLHKPIGHLEIIDKQYEQICLNCLVNLNLSLDNILILNNQSYDLYFNLDSIILIRILSDNTINNENLPLNISFNVYDRINPSIITTKTYSFTLKLNKENVLMNSKMFYLKINENTLLNEKIQFNHRLKSCLNNQTKQLILFDKTKTFEFDENYNLILKKYLNIHKKQNYELNIKELIRNKTIDMNSCSIDIRIYIYDSYSILNTYPYFSQSFYILTSTNLSEFVLPLFPSYVKYKLSNTNDISIDENNRTIRIESSLLYSSNYYDFSIDIIDYQIASLSCSIPIRIFFGNNYQSPKLIDNNTKQSIQISSNEFIYDVKAYDPDLLIIDQDKQYPPSIEYNIESFDNVMINRYTGRIYLYNITQTNINLTLILTDFGQPYRLISRRNLILNILSNEKVSRQEISMIVSTTFMLISACLLCVVILFIIILFLYRFCYERSTRKKSLTNLSPITADCRLIDNDYISTTITSLPRVNNREQRIYPAISNDSQKKVVEQIQFSIPITQTTEIISTQQDQQQNLSINDINKYLERFEKLYNNLSEFGSHEPVGSVV